MEKAPIPKSYFIDPEKARAFYGTLTRRIAERREEMAGGGLISPANIRRFKHGGAWRNPNAPQAFGGEMERHGVTAETPNQAIRENDLGAIARLVDGVAVDMDRQFLQMVYRTTSDACDASGNVVNAQESGGLAEALLDIFKKIELTADVNGEVSMPQLHVGSDAARKLMVLQANPPPGFDEKMEAIKARKIAEAQAREVERKARFVDYGEEG